MAKALSLGLEDTFVPKIALPLFASAKLNVAIV